VAIWVHTPSLVVSFRFLLPFLPTEGERGCGGSSLTDIFRKWKIVIQTEDFGFDGPLLLLFLLLR
jgi:hypothetical protein